MGKVPDGTHLEDPHALKFNATALCSLPPLLPAVRLSLKNRVCLSRDACMDGNGLGERPLYSV